jgi:hypothetical protein
MTEPSWTYPELQADLQLFERQLKAAGLKPTSIQTYTDRTSRFLRWLVGDYTPRPPVG